MQINPKAVNRKSKEIIKGMIGIGNDLKLCYQCNLREKAGPLLRSTRGRVKMGSACPGVCAELHIKFEEGVNPAEDEKERAQCPLFFMWWMEYV